MNVDARTLQTIAALHREADRLDREADRLGRVVAYPAIDHCNAKRARARALEVMRRVGWRSFSVKRSTNRRTRSSTP